MDIVLEAIKKEAWHKEFFDSLEKSPPKTIGELMTKVEKYIRLDNASKG